MAIKMFVFAVYFFMKSLISPISFGNSHKTIFLRSIRYGVLVQCIILLNVVGFHAHHSMQCLFYKSDLSH